MTDKKLVLAGILFIIVLLVIQQYIIWNTPKKDDIVLKKINNIERKIDSLSINRDSIKNNIKKIDKEIDTNAKNYEEVVNIIINNDDSVNRIFIDNYIKDYIDRITTK